MGVSDSELDGDGVRGRPEAVRRHDKLVDALRASLWFRPALWMILLFGLALGLVALDTWMVDQIDDEQVPRLLRSHPDDARALLGAIVGAMLTVVSLAFSVVMVAVVQMSNAYSPRLLRSYLADVHNQHVLGILIGTFLYSLIVLRSVRQTGFSPTVATNVGVALAVLSTIALITFLHHVPQSMKVNSIIRMILEDCEEELDRAFPDRVGVECVTIPSAEELSEEPQRLSARHSGYVQIFDMAPLLGRERSSPVVIRMHWRMGEFLLRGTPFASVWGEFGDEDREALDRACVYGGERTMRQDPRFGVEQLTDVALRALSTGINDPTTACAAINALTVLFGKLLAHDQVSPWRSDHRGQIRVEFRTTTVAELIELSYLRILVHGGGDLQVVRRLIGACEQLEVLAEDPAQRVALAELLQAIHETACAKLTYAAHRRTLQADFERVREPLGLEPPSA
ncbi:MAG: DUF2254 domain-containing protein [Enhygromyxa sp.]